MKWALRIGAFLASLVLLYGYLALLHPGERVDNHELFRARPIRSIAHRGGAALWPENTMHAFQKALELGVDMIEMDVRPAADGTLVVMHDDTVDRTTNGTGTVASLSVEALRKLDAGYHFEAEDGERQYRGQGLAVPLFEDVLKALPGARLNIEMKNFGPAEVGTFCALLRRYQAERSVLVGSFDHEPMRTFREACPDVATSATVREGLAYYQLHRLGIGSLYRGPAVAFQVPERFGDIHVIEPLFLQRAARTNLRVQVWTVNEIDDMMRLLALGVDAILTDRPDLLLEVLRGDE
jgi:glycerophosphoryl diester phosphodiesterase